MDKIVVNGHKYSAVESPTPGLCGKCAFKLGFGCRLEQLTGNALQYCSAKNRQDGKDVYFVLACKG
jgi:hypothetical protein